MNNKNEQDKLLSSNYDGIQEYDNALPRWWVWLFILTIIFAPIYIVYKHGGIAPSQDEVLNAQLKELSSQHAAAAPAAVFDNASLLKIVKDPTNIEKGKALFAAKCAPCHGPDGGGIVGPNLTDDNWIHGGTLPEIRKTIVEGVVEKGMVPWGPVLSADEINQALAFVWSLHGTHPANPKAPQGDLVTRVE